MERNGASLYVWFDTEYTTLELEDAWILQVAALVTDSDLKRVLPPERDVVMAIRLPETAVVSPWVEENLPELVAKSRSPQSVEISAADGILAGYVKEASGKIAAAENKRPILAGNSIHMDWRLVQRFLPKFAGCLNYRHLDVSSIKLEWLRLHPGSEADKDDNEFIRQHFPEAVLPKGDTRHSAYYDVQASIAELSFYRKNLFKK